MKWCLGGDWIVFFTAQENKLACDDDHANEAKVVLCVFRSTGYLHDEFRLLQRAVDAAGYSVCCCHWHVASRDVGFCPEIASISYLTWSAHVVFFW
mgnify:CR=1 FL=1